ncbi:MAG: cupin domain-containing protein [Chloroflexi bacterium]|nr:cupin domain-containing protein [Chloroflexota bacterium]
MEGNVWTIDGVLAKHPADPQQPVSWAFLFHGPHVTLNVVQVQDSTGLKPHLHQDHDDLIYVVSGHGTFRVGDRDHEVQPGAIIAAPRGVVHGPRFAGPAVLLSVYGPPFDPQHPDRIFVEE